MVNNTALANNLNNSIRAKNKKGKTVRGYQALNAMGEQTSDNIEEGIVQAKKEIVAATTDKKRRIATAKLYTLRVAQGLMLAPFAFFVWLFVDTIII